MIKLNVHEAKTHLSRYLAEVEKGETVILCKRNVPIAEIRPLARTEPRPIGLGVGTGRIDYDPLEPLSEEELAMFYDEPLVSPGDAKK